MLAMGVSPQTHVFMVGCVTLCSSYYFSAPLSSSFLLSLLPHLSPTFPAPTHPSLLLILTLSWLSALAGARFPLFLICALQSVSHMSRVKCYITKYAVAAL